jgi:membrane protease YdiL (CAAX protease family)
LKAFVTKYSVSCFIGLAFVISLLIGLPLKFLILNDLFADSEIGLSYGSKILVVLGPGVAAIIVSYITKGGAGVKALLSKLQPYIEHIIWWLGLPFAGLAITSLAFIAAGFTFGQLVGMATSVSPLLLLMHLGGSVLFIGLGEELGWRGWLLPKLAEGRPLKKAMLMVFVVWALWHFPLFFNGWRVAVPFLVLAFALSVIFTWLWDRVGGNVFVLAIAHASVDFPEAFFEGRIGPGHDGQILHAFAAMAVIYLIIAGYIYLKRKQQLEVILEQPNERLLPGEPKEETATEVPD